MRPRRNVFGSLSGGIFLLFLALAFIIKGFFLPIMFVGLAFAALIGSLSSLNPRGAYGGIQGFIWMMGLAFCFAFGFWPWVLVVAAVSVILGALAGPIIAALIGLGLAGAASTMNRQPPLYQPPAQSYQPPASPNQPYQPYQQGYQPPPPPQPETYQEGGRQYSYPEQYEQPQAQYPQEMPPQQ